jgi:hypothetical protein
LKIGIKVIVKFTVLALPDTVLDISRISQQLTISVVNTGKQNKKRQILVHLQVHVKTKSACTAYTMI